VTTNQSNTTNPRPASTAARVVEGIIGYAIGIACLYWLFHRLPLRPLLQSLAGVNWLILAPCVALSIAAYACVAWQWQLLLRPVGLFSFGRSAQAVFAGRFANDALPLHVGYVVRALLAARWMEVGVAAIAPSLIVERLWDGFWLAVGCGSLSLTAPLPPDVVRARNVLAATVLGGAMAVILVAFARRKTRRPAESNASRKSVLARIESVVQTMADGTRDIIQSRTFGAVLLLSLLKLAVQAAAVVLLLPACGIHLSIIASLSVFVAGYLATCAPSTPAGAGLFQVFVVGMLGYLGVARAQAAGFSLLSFVTLTVPPATAGFFALARSGLSLREIREQTRIFK
jgi:glycosyltransferase 2 family protein